MDGRDGREGGRESEEGLKSNEITYDYRRPSQNLSPTFVTQNGPGRLRAIFVIPLRAL